MFVCLFVGVCVWYRVMLCLFVFGVCVWYRVMLVGQTVIRTLFFLFKVGGVVTATIMTLAASPVQVSSQVWGPPQQPAGAPGRLCWAAGPASVHPRVEAA